MKEIKSSYNILGPCPTDINEALKRIEVAGRTAYRSQDRISVGSAERFCAMIINRGHFSVLEHSNLVLKTPHKNVNFKGPFHLVEHGKNHLFVGGNYRAWMEMELEEMPDDMSLCAKSFLAPLTRKFFYPKEDNAYKIVTNVYEIPPNLRRITVKFTIPRHITHELVRHRARIGITQSSTRYIRYNGVEAHCPPGLTEFQKDLWYRSVIRSEAAYSVLLDSGATPQIARAVLPTCVSAEIMITADMVEWAHIFDLRCSPASHPEMVSIMKPLRKEFFDRGWI